ncbi:MAG TPA: hypothetical protein VML55_17735 [Planctomycetaceae bacterium]|nr:hypothetical protein [Planctomycetaceae bacterium]
MSSVSATRLELLLPFTITLLGPDVAGGGVAVAGAGVEVGGTAVAVGAGSSVGVGLGWAVGDAGLAVGVLALPGVGVTGCAVDSLQAATAAIRSSTTKSGAKRIPAVPIDRMYEPLLPARWIAGHDT